MTTFLGYSRSYHHSWNLVYEKYNSYILFFDRLHFFTFAFYSFFSSIGLFPQCFSAKCHLQLPLTVFLCMCHSAKSCATFLLKHDVVTFPVSRIFLGHSLAFIAFIFWLLQIITGFFLLGLLSYNLEIQYSELISICFHGNFVWLLRLLHMLGANFVIFATFSHAGKSLASSRIVSPAKATIWFLGSIIFLLGLGVAFSGYVVVSGNMSYWAALVILNLASVIPFLGDEIVSGILASSTVTSWAIRRFTVLHFLLGIVAIIFVLVHIVFLHRQNPALHQTDISDGSETLLQVLVKDFSIFLMLVIFVFLDSSKSFVHPDNWQAFSRLLTPAHIEPEIYFLWTFSCVKLHNGKISGFCKTRSFNVFLRRDIFCHRVCATTPDPIFSHSFSNFCQHKISGLCPKIKIQNFRSWFQNFTVPQNPRNFPIVKYLLFWEISNLISFIP